MPESRSRPRYRRWVFAVVTLLVVAAIAGVIYLRRGRDPQPQSERRSLVDLIPDNSDSSSTVSPLVQKDPQSEPQETWLQGKYVGAAACRECHEERTDDFLHSSHFLTSRLPEPTELAEHVEKASGTLKTRNPDTWFELILRDQRLVQSGVTRKNDDDTDESLERQQQAVDIVYGAGDFDEDYFYWAENQLFQLPVVYQRSLECWTNAPGYMDGRIDFGRPVPPRCLECHATWFDHQPGTVNTYQTDNFVLGISCERCHGPGQEHVSFHQQNPDVIEAHRIAQPGDMTRVQQLDLCGQCHSNANKRKTAPFSYRPGDPLEEHFRIDLNNHPEEDHTANQHRYLQESKCFQESATMTCVTCHDPHLPREMARELSLQSCAQCHAPNDCGEHEHLPIAVRERCVECHMPSRYVNNITFDRADDQYVPIIQRHEHRIAVDPIATQTVLLNWYDSQEGLENQTQADQLRAALISALRQEADRQTQDHRYLASAGLLRESLQIQDDEETRQRLSEMLELRRTIDQKMTDALALVDQRRYDSAIELLKQVLEEKPNHPAAQGKLGLLLAETGKISEGVEHLKRVAEIDPDNGYGHALLGYIFLTQGDLAQAKQYYLLAESCEPYSAKIKQYLGQIAMQQGQASHAETYWRASLEIEPQNRQALSSLVELLGQRGLLLDAVLLVEHCVRRTNRSDPELLLLLSDLYLQTGRRESAIEALREARSATGESQMQLRQLIDQQLRQLGE